MQRVFSLDGKEEMVSDEQFAAMAEREHDTCDLCGKPSAELVYVARDGLDFICTACDSK